MSAETLTAPLTPPSILETRRTQVFPVLTSEELARLHRFGRVQHWAKGERILETGKPSPGMLVILSGGVQVSRRDGHGHDVPINLHQAGSFTGEVGQLSEGRSLVDGYTVAETNALLVSPSHLRELLVAEAELGERIMRAFILRRVGLIADGAGGPVLIGAPASPGVVRLRNFLTRNGIPHLFFDAATEPDALRVIEQYAPKPSDMPLVVCPDGSVLRNPRESALAVCIGMLDVEEANHVYDVVVVGAGPAGLSTAVYAGSEGLSVLVIDARAFGGQAGASARIENYLGFPTGISGQALTGRAYNQARKFGAHMLIPTEVDGLDCGGLQKGEPLALQIKDGPTVKCQTVVIATGARYRRPNCANLLNMEGRGVWYWASPLEAKLCSQQEVVLVGGGNSAGQAAVFLSGHASKVWMLVRGEGLAASMSRYLVDRIASIPNIELCTHTEIVGLTGTSALESVRWRSHATGQEVDHPIRNVFLFLGADPTTEWLTDCGVTLDAGGFVLTGSAGSPQETMQGGQSSLATSVPGVFAIGDVRSGSVKRVGGAIGEGAAVVAQIHAYIAACRAGAV